jgi:hypothetical protein
MTKIGRNDPCPCGSGKKYKQCCLANEVAPVASFGWQKMRKTEGELMHLLLEHAHSHYSPEAIVEAWDEFSCWNDVPFDPESQAEFETAFLPWYVFNWTPDNFEIEAAEHYPELPVAMHYVQRFGDRLDAFQRRFIEEICSQFYSFFMVTAVEPGRQLSLRDLVLGREITVHERQASMSLQRGSIIYTRVITMDNNSIMVGCAPTVIPPDYLNEFIDLREKMAEQLERFGTDFLADYDIELRQIYYDIHDELFNPVLPQLQNTDGDPMEEIAIYYTLSCTPREAVDSLATLSLEKDGQSLLDMHDIDQAIELESFEFPWLKKGNKQHAGWDNTVLGHITIDADLLTISVNSQERADAIKRKISRRLGKRAQFRNAVIQSSEQMLREMLNREPAAGEAAAAQSHEDLQAHPEVQAQLREFGEQYWREWLDLPVPALKDQTPRQAAKTEIGRERLEGLLLSFEQRSETPQPFEPDLEALRRSLGLD